MHDSLILVDFYNATNSVGWRYKWNLTQPVNSWYGVTLNGSGRVTQIRLPINLVVGNLPSDFGNLASLNYLDLESNNVSADLSTFNSNTNLTVLNLGFTHIGGTISSIVNLGKLTKLGLTESFVSGTIPSSIDKLSELTYLDLSHCDYLTGNIPASIGNLSKLDTLILSWFGQEDFNGKLPYSIGNLSNLKYLDLSDVRLDSLRLL